MFEPTLIWWICCTFAEGLQREYSAIKAALTYPYSTSFGFIGYGGPCPPPTGETHHYLFLLYAINIAHVGGQGLKFGEVISAIRGHVLGATSIIGTFHLPQ